jgi:hypothetical protein
MHQPGGVHESNVCSDIPWRIELNIVQSDSLVLSHQLVAVIRRDCLRTASMSTVDGSQVTISREKRSDGGGIPASERCAII